MNKSKKELIQNFKLVSKAATPDFWDKVNDRLPNTIQVKPKVSFEPTATKNVRYAILSVSAIIAFIVLISAGIVIRKIYIKKSNPIAVVDTTTKPAMTQISTSPITNSAKGGITNKDYFRMYSEELADINGVLLDMVDSTALNKWIQDFENGKRDVDCNILTFISEFHISKEALLNEITKYINETGFTRMQLFPLTDEQINIIYSGDMGLINKTFVNKSAVLFSDKIYPAKWILETEIDKIIAEGIPLDILKQKQDVWENDKTIFIEYEYRIKLIDKISELEMASK